MEVKVCKPYIEVGEDKHLVPMFVGIRCDFDNVDASLAHYGKVEVHQVKKEAVEPQGEEKSPHGRYVFWKASTGTFTVHEPCLPVVDDNTIPMCLVLTHKRCIACNKACEGCDRPREFKTNRKGLLVCHSTVVTYTNKEFAALPWSDEVISGVVGAMEEMDAAKADAAAKREDKAATKAEKKAVKAVKKAA